jgi:hypothetical protein
MASLMTRILKACIVAKLLRREKKPRLLILSEFEYLIKCHFKQQLEHTTIQMLLSAGLGCADIGLTIYAYQ